MIDKPTGIIIFYGFSLGRILYVEHGNECILMTEIWIENQPKIILYPYS